MAAVPAPLAAPAAAALAPATACSSMVLAGDGGPASVFRTCATKDARPAPLAAHAALTAAPPKADPTSSMPVTTAAAMMRAPMFACEDSCITRAAYMTAAWHDMAKRSFSTTTN